MVMAQSLFKALKRVRPEITLDVLAPDWCFPLLERMPEVRKGLPMPVGHGQVSLGVRRELGKSLRSEHYSQAIVLPNSLKSALIPWFAKIPKRTGWKGEMRYGLLNDLRVLDKTKLPLMIDRFNALAFAKNAIEQASDFPAPHDYPELSVDPMIAQQAREKFSLNDTSPVLVLCPGAEFGEAKRWPAEHYAGVAKAKLSEGYQVWLMGSKKDHPVCDEIIKLLPTPQQEKCHNLAGTTSLGEAIDLMSFASAVISNDSGLMHIAAALGRTLVVVYGSTSPQFTPPLSDRKRIVSLGLECSPCFKRVCPLGHTNCLKQLESSQVLAALEDLENAL
jgi:heptosyltransferase-2